MEGRPGVLPASAADLTGRFLYAGTAGPADPQGGEGPPGNTAFYQGASGG